MHKSVEVALDGLMCFVCGGVMTPHIVVSDNRTGVFKGNYEYVRCGGCGVLSVRPRPSSEELRLAYGTGYGPYLLPGIPGRAGLKFRRLWHVLDGQATVDRVPVEGRVLDVGAGAGDVVAALCARGMDAVGIEPNAAAVEAARAARVPVVQGTLETLGEPLHSFDTVILNQVIEHVPSPEETLKRTHQLLRPGGRVVLFTPNPYGWGARLFGHSWAHWHAPYHLTLFGPDGLRALLAATSYDIERLSTVSPSFWIRMSFEAWLHRHDEQWVFPKRDWQLPKPFRVLLAPVLRLLDSLLGGDCLIVVGRARA
jgi:SAM-dependent methyltransferase